jgi:hypothetical protein
MTEQVGLAMIKVARPGIKAVPEIEDINRV